MDHRIFKPGIRKIDLSDIACRKLLKEFIRQLQRIRIGRLLNNIGTVPGNMVAISVQGILSLFSDTVDLQILFFQIAPCDQLDNIGVIAACKPSVRGNDDHCLLGRITGMQIAMLHPPGLF